MKNHHGDTRIIRFVYDEGASYVPFVKRAGQLWRELEAKTNDSLFLQTGVKNIGETNHTFLQNVRESAKLYDLPLEQYTAAEVMEKWPGLTLPDELVVVCFEPTAGVLRVEDCIHAYQKLALARGAFLHTHEKVHTIQAQEIIQIHTEKGVNETKQLIVTAGAWASELLQTIDLSLPITPTRKTFAWFEADDRLYRDTIFPAYCFEFANSSYYVFPSIDGAGLKLGRHEGGEAINSNEQLLPFDEQDGAELQHFIIDFLHNHQNIAIAAGFSGHGFKFSSAVSEVLADFILYGESKQDLSLFQLNRFA